MTFCTVCAAPVDPNLETCGACGARLDAHKAAARKPLVVDRPGAHLALVRGLYLSPIILALVLGGAFAQRENARQEWLASAYGTAQQAANAGDLVAARDAFSDLVGYRDADVRAAEMRALLAPLEGSYADGVRAIENGDYEAAVELLQPVADAAPALEDVAFRLDDAKRLLADELRREADGSETIRNWPAVEQTLRRLVALAPDDAASRSRLAQLQREHGPLVLGRDRALWLVSPDGSEETRLSDSHQVIWPTWSPDRSRVAFLAPNPDDPMGNVALYVVPLDGAPPHQLADGVSAHTAPSWSPDGTRIAYTSFAGYDPVYETGAIGVRVVDLASGEETNLTGSDHLLAFNPAWSPDGTEIAFTVKYQGMSERPQHSHGDILIANLESGAIENVTNGAVRYVWNAAWSPRGDEILLYSLFGQTWYEPPSTSIRRLDRATGEISDVAHVNEAPTMPVWSPDGSRYAYTVDENTVVIAAGRGKDGDAGSREQYDVTDALSGEITWSPDGQALLLAPWNDDAPSTLIDLTRPEATQSSVELEFDANPPFISPPQWAPAVAMPPEENPAVMTDPATATGPVS